MGSVRDEYRVVTLARWNTTQAAARRMLGAQLADALASQAARLIGEPAPVASAAFAAPTFTSPTFTSPTSAADVAVLALAEQMVIDVGRAAALVPPVAERVGVENMREYVSAMWVVEYTERIRAMGARFFELQPGELVPVDCPGMSMRDLLAAYQNDVVLGQRLDVVTTELVRLRCGRTHQCRICQTLRLDSARSAGVDETMTAKIDHYERSDLSERHKLALRITDAMILRPDLLSAESVGAALAEFGAETLLELCLDISKWSTQKIVVTLGLDGTERLPLNDQGVTWFDFGDDGAVSGFWA